MLYRRKGIVEAVQWNGKNHEEIKAFAKQFAMFDYADVTGDGALDYILKIKTAERIVPAKIGDYVVRGTKGDFSLQEKEEFESAFEPVS